MRYLAILAALPILRFKGLRTLHIVTFAWLIVGSPLGIGGFPQANAQEDDPALGGEVAGGEVAGVQIAVAGQAMMAFPAMGMPETSKILGAKQFQLERVYALEIRHIDSVAKLDAGQKAKLNAGSKAVAKKVTRDFAKMFAEPGEAMEFNVIDGNVQAVVKPANDEPQEVEIAEVKDFSEIDQNTMIYMQGGFPGGDALQHEQWTKLIKTVLSAEQLAKFDKLKLEEEKAKTRAIIEAGLVSLAPKLALTPEQIEKLKPAIVDAAAKLERERKELFESGLLEMMGFKVYLASVDRTALAEVLDSTQFELVQFDLQDMMMFMPAVDARAVDIQMVEPN